MGEVLKQVNEYTRFVSMLDEGYHMWDFMREIAKPDGDGYPPTLIFGERYDSNEFGTFPLTEAWLKQIDTGDLELLARHIRIVLGLGAGDVVVETLRDNNYNYDTATMVVVATPEWREMVGYKEDLKPSDYREIKCWWQDDFDVAVLERLETTVTVGLDGITSEDSEWVEDEDSYTYPVYGYGNERDAYLEAPDQNLSERLPVRYIASYSASVEGESAESVLKALRARVKSDLVIR